MENSTDSSEITNSAKGQTNKKGKKINPSFKSKRYRDKLRTEVKTLESLVPVNRTTLHKKLDSQTVYRLAIAYLRIKSVLTGLYNTKYECTTEEVHGMPECIGTIEGRFEPGQQLDTWPFDRQILYQILEGFIVVVSADGTLMFVSENVSQYTGFNQVDVLHRCIYGLIHPEDQHVVKDVLENNHIHHQQYAHPKTSLSNEGTVEHLSFFCRIKCYHGNTVEHTNCGGNTVAYTKFHCTGTLRSILELPHTNKTSIIVAILYCRPFYITGNDVHDSSNAIFWSKHDLDLTFQDMEDRGCHILGYSSGELSGTTLYQLVQPEDLPILTHVHTAVTSCSEVQTFRFRLQAKNGNWIWLQSKGKVVSKNAKKYSIIFTHCPVRDEEDEFLQEESVIRRSRFMNYISSVTTCRQDLSVGNNMFQTNDGSNRLQHDQLTTQEQPDGFNCHYVDSNQSIPHYSVCPSSWHMDKDRHSPILPSSQVTNKASMKDRYFRLNELHKVSHVKDPTWRSSKCCYNPGKRTPHLPNMTSRSDITPYPSCRADSLHCNNSQNLRIKRSSANIYDCPYNQTNWYAFDNVTEVPYNVPIQYHPYRGTVLYPQGLDTIYKDTNYLLRFADQQRQNIYSSANIRFSMVCDTNISLDKRLHGTSSESPHFTQSTFNHNVEHVGQKKDIKPEPDDQSCAFLENLEMTEKRTTGVKYDVEASVYMRIVESQNSGFGKEMSSLGGWHDLLYN